ncbi:MAG: FAD-dependent oxidoreductase, partial [Oligoflexia bacterium]|nr:FAD-dependent oxidoreductase [Oligoflexia bacterium]
LAIDTIFKLAQEYNIECGLKRSKAYFYAVKPEDIVRLEKEFITCEHAGIDVNYIEAAPLPFKTYGSICYNNQGQFNPRQYLLTLAKSIPDSNGSAIYENSVALEIKEVKKNGNSDKNYEVITDKGVIRAKKVIVATHFPFPYKGLFFAKMKVCRSYVLGIRIADELPEELFYSSTDPYYYIRTHQDSKGKLVIVGGEDHVTAEERNTLECYQSIKKFAENHFNVQSIDYSWSTQDNYTFDELPYIGKVSKDNPNLYVATGFNGSGMIYGTLSGVIIADLIEGNNDYSYYQDFYDPSRLNILDTGKDLFSRNLHVAEMYVGDRLSSMNKVNSLDKIAAGSGSIAHINGKDLAVYRDDDNKIYALSPVCRHLGCRLRYNEAERSWDCPCHGSRYGVDGNILHGPALKTLEKYKI